MAASQSDTKLWKSSTVCLCHYGWAQWESHRLLETVQGSIVWILFPAWRLVTTSRRPGASHRLNQGKANWARDERERNGKGGSNYEGDKNGWKRRAVCGKKLLLFSLYGVGWSHVVTGDVTLLSGVDGASLPPVTFPGEKCRGTNVSNNVRNGSTSSSCWYKQCQAKMEGIYRKSATITIQTLTILRAAFNSSVCF